LRALGLSLQIVEASSERDLAPAFASLAANRASTLYIDGDSLFTGLRAPLAALATQHAMPTVFNERESVERLKAPFVVAILVGISVFTALTGREAPTW